MNTARNVIENATPHLDRLGANVAVAELTPDEVAELSVASQPSLADREQRARELAAVGLRRLADKIAPAESPAITT